MLHIETKKELVTDDKKSFSLFSDIAFSILNKKTKHLDRVICRIIGMNESDYGKDNGYIVGDMVEINRHASHEQIFFFKDMQDISYVYYD